MNLKIDDNNNSQYFSTLEDVKPDYVPIKVHNLLQFYRLKGKKITLIAENIEPIPDLKYVVFSAFEKRYYLRTYRSYDLDTFYWYRPTLTFSGEDDSVNSLRNYIYDGNVHILFTNEQVEEMRKFLQRLWKSHLVGEGKVPYKLFLNLLDQSLKLEDFKEYSEGLTGFRTVCKQFEDRIAGIWDEIYKTKT
jgi:hypothetical protein